MRAAGHDEATTADCATWICRFIHFHNKRHPREMGSAEVGRFLEHVARTSKTLILPKRRQDRRTPKSAH
jgi:hypothetical protein